MHLWLHTHRTHAIRLVGGHGLAILKWPQAHKLFTVWITEVLYPAVAEPLLWQQNSYLLDYIIAPVAVKYHLNYVGSSLGA